MSPEKENIIFETFPKIFPRGRDVDPRENLMCFGFECGDGWFDIIYNLCEHLQTHIDHYTIYDKDGEWKPAQITVVQVKEKFGTLRFYDNGCGLINQKKPDDSYKRDTIADGIIAHACFLSGKTCEVCGAKGRVRGGGWVRCLCEKCAEELSYPSDTEQDDIDSRDI